MATDTTTQQVEAAARALLDGRINAVRELARVRQARLDKQAELDTAERKEAQAWAAALGAGWTAKELRDVGLTEPNRKAPGRPKASARPKAAVRKDQLAEAAPAA